MTAERFNVVLQGTTPHGRDIATVAAELARLIERDIDVARHLLRGQPTPLKSGVDAATGARYIEALERIGVAVRLEPEALELDAELSARSVSGEQSRVPTQTNVAGARPPAPVQTARDQNTATAPREDLYQTAVTPKNQDSGKGHIPDAMRTRVANAADDRAQYVGFWWRFLASTIDGLILGASYSCLLFAINLLPAPPNISGWGTLAILYVTGLILSWLYYAGLESSAWGATIGKKSIGARVVDLRSERISFERATARYFGKFLSGLMTLGLGYILAGLTERKQALHDTLAGTLVVRADAGALSEADQASPPPQSAPIAQTPTELARDSRYVAPASIAPTSPSAPVLSDPHREQSAGPSGRFVGLAVLTVVALGVGLVSLLASNDKQPTTENTNARAEPVSTPQPETTAAASQTEQTLVDAHRGDVAAQLNLGYMYYKGDGVPQDYAEAARRSRKAADQGNVEAQGRLGFMYASGKGVAQDYTEALKWYLNAAGRGNSNAQSNLGAMYASGQGVAQDYAEALKWYRKAADQGNAGAQFNIGEMYMNRQGVPQDYVQAYIMFSLAAEHSTASQTELKTEAVKNRNNVATKMTATQIAEAENLAREWKQR